MVDIAAAVNDLPGARPVAGLDGCWTWSGGKFHFTLALTADGKHAMQLNCRGEMDLELVLSVLSFARDHSETVISAAPMIAIEGFSSPSATPFDTVASVIPAVHGYLEYDNKKLNEVTFAVFPGYRCEFSGKETQKEATYRFDRMLDVVNLNRGPSPWVLMRYDNPKTGAGSVGDDLGIASSDVLLRELRNLEGADGAFVEFENFRQERRKASWSGELEVSNGDTTRTSDMTDLLAWAYKFVYEGVDDAA
jgi:hypothetical protein